MKFCPECGKEWNGSKFCAECGADLRSYINGNSELEQAPVVKEEMAFSADFDFLDQIDNLAEKAETERKRMEAEAKAAEENRRKKEAEAERMRKEAEARAAEEKRRKEEAERQEAARQAEYKKRREALFSQKFQRNGNFIIFGRFPQSYAEGITSSGPDGYCTVEGKEYYRVNSKEQKIFRTVTKAEHYKVEPIRWEILQETDQSVFVASEKILAARAFREDRYANRANDYINSDIRKWLNGEFLNRAFSREEQAYILPTDIDYNMDKIFLLSKEEDQLRSPRFDTDNTHFAHAYTDHIGLWLRDEISYDNYYHGGVLPALRIDKTKLC